jgi:antagonist of KipI
VKATVNRAGFFTTVQDLGRPGFRRFGVSLGGALDSLGLRLANLLVGNDENSAGLEVAVGGLRLRFDDERIVAWCGGDFPARIGSMPLPAGHAAVVRAGDELVIDPPKIGFRAWLAISGGLGVPVVLGSRSTDLRSGFGGWQGRTIRDGDEIPLGENGPRAGVLLLKLRDRKIGNWKPPHLWRSPASATPIARFIQGADWSRFAPSSREAFTSAKFVVSSDSDRMGARLTGPVLDRIDHGDLVSEVVAPGTVQVPPGGEPILLLGDCQTIGGYPKIAHVITVDLPIAAQVRPGDTVLFKEVSLTVAHQLLLTRDAELEQFRCGLASQFL